MTPTTTKEARKKMMRSEFEQLSGIYPDLALWEEIERLYMLSEGKDKAAFVKDFKRNKDGIAEIAAERADKKRWEREFKVEKDLEKLKAELKEAERTALARFNELCTCKEQLKRASVSASQNACELDALKRGLSAFKKLLERVE